MNTQSEERTAGKVISNYREASARSLRAKCRAVAKDPKIIGVYSTGERCAVALILDRADLLCRGDTMLYAAHRVGEEWLEICWQIQRDGWDAA